MTLEEFKNKIHIKKKSATGSDFAFEIRIYFENLIKGRKISNFQGVKEFVVTYQIKCKQ